MYVECGKNTEAVELWDNLCKQGVPLDSFSFALALTACANLMARKKGEEVYSHFSTRYVKFPFLFFFLIGIYPISGVCISHVISYAFLFATLSFPFAFPFPFLTFFPFPCVLPSVIVD